MYTFINKFKLLCLISLIPGTQCYAAAKQDTSKEIIRSTILNLTGPVRLAAFSPDGRFIITASGDHEHTTHVWDTQDWLLKYTLSNPTACLFCSATLSPTASDNHKAGVRDIKNWSSVHTLSGHTGDIFMAALSPNRRFIVIASNDSTARILDTNNLSLVHTLSGHTGPVNSATFSPDGRFIATTSDDGTARIWEDTRVQAQTKEIAQLLCMTQKQRLGADSPLHKISDDQFLIQYITSLAKPDSFEPVEQKSWLSSCVIQ